VQTPETRQQLMDWALGRATGDTDWTSAIAKTTACTRQCFKLPRGSRVEAVITKARNGLAINFPDPSSAGAIRMRW